MTRTKKNQVGDWIAIPMRSDPGGERAAKILEVKEDNDECWVRVKVRYDNGVQDAWFAGPLPRVHWRRQNGKARWSKR